MEEKIITMKDIEEHRKKVQREYMREWRKKNREKCNGYRKVWAENNKDKIREYNDKYWEKKAIDHINKKEV